MPEAIDTQELGRELRARFADFAAKRAANDPGFLARFTREGRRAGALAAPFALLPGAGPRLHGRRYLFLSTRFAELASSFSAEEAAIIGGPRDRAPAAALGLPFVFTGDLAAAAGALLFGHRWIPADRVVRRWARFFSRQHDDCVLLVPNDTLPVSLLLVAIARRCRNVTVACLQHGLFNSGYDDDDIEGRNSHLNLVYSEAQRREMERRLPGALVEVMGLPEQLRCVDDSAPTRRVVLVGIGTLEERERYRAALQLYRSAAQVLGAQGFEIAYRPHPSEAGVHEGKDEFPQELQPRRQLLAGSRRAFVGFCSTLLYEAQAAGHAVIVLDDPRVPGYAIEPIGLRVASAELERLPDAIDAQARPGMAPATLPARRRLETALSHAQARLAESRS